MPLYWSNRKALEKLHNFHKSGRSADIGGSADIAVPCTGHNGESGKSKIKPIPFWEWYCSLWNYPCVVTLRLFFFFCSRRWQMSDNQISLGWHWLTAWFRTHAILLIEGNVFLLPIVLTEFIGWTKYFVKFARIGHRPPTFGLSSKSTFSHYLLREMHT